MHFLIIIEFVFFSSIFFSISFVGVSFAQQELSVYQQWKQFTDPDTLTCKQGFLLLQKNNIYPACVTPYAYLKLIDRGYGSSDLSTISKHTEMLNLLLHYMVSNEKLTHHWHEMLQKNNNVMTQTMVDWVLQMKHDPKLLNNMLGPMTNDPELRKQMIQTMKNHSTMEFFLKQDYVWMESIHRPITTSDADKYKDPVMGCDICDKFNGKMSKPSCSWCPEYEIKSIDKSKTFSNSEKIMDLIHDIWIDSGMNKDVHDLMIKNPSHVAQMADQLMEPMLNAVMDDDILRPQMINLILENDDFMNSIRHDNTSQRH